MDVKEKTAPSTTKAAAKDAPEKEPAVSFLTLIREADVFDCIFMLVGGVAAGGTGALQPWCVSLRHRFREGSLRGRLAELLAHHGSNLFLMVPPPPAARQSVDASRAAACAASSSSSATL